MTFGRPSRALAAVAVAALALTACSTLQNANPFKSKSAQSHASPGERISLLELNDQLKVADALRGQDFLLPPPQPIADWPLPGGTPEQSVENVAAAQDFAVAWRTRFGKGGDRRFFVTATPVAAEGKVFVMDGEADVSAHDARTGAQLWRVNVMPKSKRDREAFGGGVAYAAGKLYVSSGFRLVAQLDAATGRIIWEARTDAPLHSAPTVGDGRVYVVDVDDQLLTFNADTGAPDWTYQALTEPARILAASSPALTSDTVVASFASGELVALRADNGTELWNQSLSRASRNNALSEIRDIAGRPVIYKGDVFAVSHSDVMAATDLRTGSLRWQLPISATTAPWAAGDVVYVIDLTGRAICISRDSGQIYWIHNLNPDDSKGKKKKKKKGERVYWSTPILASGRLVTVSSHGDAVALNAKTGAEERSLKLGSDALIGPIAAGSMLYVATDKAELVAIR
ncbi:MAG: PQQ-binding-like beta-propeller repeat protein [Caulobacterales bacterium]|jgi:outer membrane protein assembly factor BamB